MSPLGWMVGSSAGSWAAIAAAAGERAHPELLFGMLGPLASAVVTWVAVERTFRAAPERLTGVMIVGFGVKMVLFGAYVAIMLRLAGLRPIPFVAGFTGYFIALHMMEALFLRRLLTGAARAHGSSADL
jgi:hypothetical protein